MGRISSIAISSEQSPPTRAVYLLPALRCAAHVMLKARRTPQTLLDYVSAGVAMQRLWL